MERRAVQILRIVALALSLHSVVANQRTHKYKEAEPVTLWVNKVGPYDNPQETYNYHRLPFCRKPGPRPQRAWGGLGEVLQGNELWDSQLDLKFKVPIADKVTICTQTLDDGKAARFVSAIERQFWFEWYIDDLPLWGFLGESRAEAETGKETQYIFTHKAFEITYNGDQIIHVNLTCDGPVAVVPGAVLTWTYSVTWTPTDVPFARRFESYLDSEFFGHKIHWFSILNSGLMVVFLVGLVMIVLMRTLRRDFARYAQLGVDDTESLEHELAEESGWKMVHGDVFRPPPNLVCLAAAVGTGGQLAVLCVFVVLLTIAGNYFQERGTILTAFIVCYAFTSGVGGYISGALYARHDGLHWIRAMLLTGGLFPGVCFGIALGLNTIAIFYRSLAAVPFLYIVLVVGMWAFISFPLCLAGTVLGRHWAGVPHNPCRVKRIPSPIPDRPWYHSRWAIMLAGGLLPFGSIFIEMYFVLTSVWQYKVYYVWGFMLLVLLILIIVCCCVTVVGTYFLLNSEDHRWQWSAFGMGASTSLYVGVYAMHYFWTKTKMTGLFQTAFYLGYTGMFCTGLALVCGSIGYMASAAFVRAIYRGVKCD